MTQDRLAMIMVANGRDLVVANCGDVVDLSILRAVVVVVVDVIVDTSCCCSHLN